MSSLAVMGFAVICAFLVVFLRQQSAAFSLLVCVAGCIVVLLYTINRMRATADIFRALFSLTQLEDYQVLLKIIGLTILTQTAQDVCLDAGQKALAGKVNLCGRVAVILAALPAMQAVVNILTGILL